MKVERITTYDRFVAVKKEWNTFLSSSGQNCPFFTHQWFDAWWQSFGQNKTLDILFVRNETDSLVGIAPMMMKNEVLQFIASLEVTDYCDFISSVDKRVEFYKILLDFYIRNFSQHSCMELISVPESSPTLSILPRLAAKHGLISEIQESEGVPILTLPGSYQEYCVSLGRKNRHELRRKIRKLKSLGHIHIDQIRESEKLKPVIQEFISLHKESSSSKQEFWQEHGMSDFFETLVDLFSSVSWVEVDILYFENRFIAALLNFLYEDTVYFYNIAYDRDYSSYSPGFFLFDHSIKQAIAQGRKIANFLRGREKYKYFFGAKESKICSLKLKQKEKKT
jgi:CelD/BcsL family acetyltransferase involved in cellulose biosynthesis